MELSKEAIERGFRIKGGRLVRYDKNGRKRKHWQTQFRNKSRRFLKKKCELCSEKEYLTIHHKRPMSSAKSPEELEEIVLNKNNCQTLCRYCHEEIEHEEIFILEQGLWGEYRIV